MRISSICTKEEFVNSRPSLEIFQYVCMHGLSLIPLTGGVQGTRYQYPVPKGSQIQSPYTGIENTFN